MKFFNVHRVKPVNLESVLNLHAYKGYDVRWFGRIGDGDLIVVFEHEVGDTDGFDAWVAAQQKRHPGKPEKKEKAEAVPA